MKIAPYSSLRAAVVIFLAAITGFIPLFAQKTPHVQEWLDAHRKFTDFQQVEMFSMLSARPALQNTVDEATILSLDAAGLSQIVESAPLAIELAIPVSTGENLELELARVDDLLTSDFRVTAHTAYGDLSVEVPTGIHYRGVIKGKPNSLAAVSFFENEMMALLTDEFDSYQVGKLDDQSGNYIFYATSDLKAANPFNCSTGDLGPLPVPSDRQIEERFVGCKVVRAYLECDYKMYQDFGSSTNNVVNYVTGLFNQVTTLYANEDIDVDLSEIYVWTTVDPYANIYTISQILNQFAINRGTSFNGDLAHFLSTRGLGGGVAYLDVLCYKEYAYGVSGIQTTYSNVPTYSWSVEVITHEMGHNLGSYHTHDCVWNGNNTAIDGCGPAAGYNQGCTGPLPPDGGTIMSYCHLVGGVGINFNNGFGPQPGDLIRDRVLNAACLTTSGTAPTGLTTSNITQASATCNWLPVTGAINYTVQYKTSASSTWLTAGTTPSTSMNLSNLTAGTAYNWKVKTDCSGYSTVANFTTQSPPSCAPTGLASSNITYNSATLNWNASAGATSYAVEYKKSSVSTWTVKTSTTNTYNLTGLSSSTAYNWRIKANNCATYSAVENFSTTAQCSKPGGMTNNSVGSTTATVSWTASSGAVNYLVQIRLRGASSFTDAGTVAVTNLTFTGLTPNKEYEWRVRANCSDWTGTKRFKTTAAPFVSFVQGGKVDIIVSPNPVRDLLYLQVNGSMPPATSIAISDMTGRVQMRSGADALVDGIFVGGLSSGVYFLTLEHQGKRIATEKFVKLP